jgi:hypothetical protein
MRSMKAVECPREQDVLDALAAGSWPGRSEHELRVHVAACGICSDLAEVVCALRDDQDQAWQNARVPSSAVMWWRAQMRARQEAARQVAWPISFAQGIAAVSAIVVASALLAAWSPSLLRWIGGVVDGDMPALPRVDLGSVLLAQGWLIPALIAGIWLVLAPVAVYFAIADD